MAKEGQGVWVIKSNPSRTYGTAQRVRDGKVLKTAKWAKMENGEIHVIGNQGNGPIPKAVLQKIKEATDPCK